MDPAQQQFQQQQETTDAGHIRLLSIFHYVYGGFAFLGLIFLFFHYYMMRFVMTEMPASGSNPAELEQIQTMFGFFIYFYILMGAFLILLGIGNIVCGRFLTARINKVFIFIIAGLNCLNMPLGTVLGVFTIIVLVRPSVAASFAARRTI